MNRANIPALPSDHTAALPGELQQQASGGAASPRPLDRRHNARASALRARLQSLYRLRAACEARGGRINVSAYDAAGKRHSASFTDRLTVIELRDGVRRAIENTEMRLARLELKSARPSTRRLA
ncbi:MAG: hypothetical protein AAB295_04620 [Chloroflexota bacterium]